jgi:hypothetical protein
MIRLPDRLVRPNTVLTDVCASWERKIGPGREQRHAIAEGRRRSPRSIFAGRRPQT